MSEEIKRVISDSLRKLRIEKEVEVAMMADILGIPRSTLETYLYARSIPPLDTVIHICNQYQVSINDFLTPLIQKPNEQDSISQVILVFESLSQFQRGIVNQIVAPIVQSMAEGIPELSGVGFGQRARILREDYRLSLVSAAQSCGIAPDSLKVLESNQRLPSISTFLEFCKTLHVSPEYLLSDRLEYLSVDKRFYTLSPRQLSALAECTSRLKKALFA
ncbi:MAG: helix-turn-helix transcriptional regulator [Oscillospiraceae bacterium]|nr:helix-turn-helix transcriptional regulator [Oscillospiraceae bacterium]